MASGNNQGQKGYLLASPQYALVPDPRQNEKNNWEKKPLLHWCHPNFPKLVINATKHRGSMN